MAEDDITPMAYIGSTLGNAYFSGVGFDVMFEAVTLTHEVSDKSFCQSSRDEVAKFRRLDAAVSAAIWAKEHLEKLVEEWRPHTNS